MNYDTMSIDVIRFTLNKMTLVEVKSFMTNEIKLQFKGSKKEIVDAICNCISTRRSNKALEKFYGGKR